MEVQIVIEILGPFYRGYYISRTTRFGSWFEIDFVMTLFLGYNYSENTSRTPRVLEGIQSSASL
jgi:hypothetical protein